MASDRGRSTNDMESGEAVPPRRMANVPPQTTMLDHSFTLQAVMELTKSVAELGAKTDRLISDVKGHGEKIDDIRQKVSFVKGTFWVIGAIIVVLSGIAGWYAKTIAATTPSTTVAPASPMNPR